MKKNKVKLILGSVAVVIVVAISILGFTYYSTINNPIKSKDKEITIEVKEGEGFYSLLNRLEEEGIIKNKTFIKLSLKLNNTDVNIIPGTYTIDSNSSLEELMETLKKEDMTKNQVKVTIPEGYNIDQMGDKFQEAGLFTKEEWLKAVKEYKTPSFVQNADKTRYPLEGYLYADTYMFKKDATPDYVIDLMLKEFNKTIKEVEASVGAPIKEEDLTKIITIASLIEEESRTDEDRALISSVIYNRLEKPMKLQIDATVLYAHGKHLEKVYYKDLEIESPYNTYFVTGLPIGPIASPSKESIIAAIKPEKTDYLYYLLTNDKKSHFFTDSYEEHQKKKKEFGY